MLFVIGHCLWSKQYLVATEPKPPAEIHILIVGDEVFVETSHLPKQVSPDHHCGTTGSQQLARFVVPFRSDR